MTGMGGEMRMVVVAARRIVDSFWWCEVKLVMLFYQNTMSYVATHRSVLTIEKRFGLPFHHFPHHH